MHFSRDDLINFSAFKCHWYSGDFQTFVFNLNCFPDLQIFTTYLTFLAGLFTYISNLICPKYVLSPLGLCFISFTTISILENHTIIHLCKPEKHINNFLIMALSYPHVCHFLLSLCNATILVTSTSSNSKSVLTQGLCLHYFLYLEYFPPSHSKWL